MLCWSPALLMSVRRLSVSDRLFDVHGRWLNGPSRRAHKTIWATPDAGKPVLSIAQAPKENSDLDIDWFGWAPGQPASWDLREQTDHQYQWLCWRTGYVCLAFLLIS